MSTTESDAALPTCRCGHDRNHHAVNPEHRWGFWAWVFLLNGASATPKEITFRCRKCGEVVEVTRERAVLEEFR